MNAGHSQQVAEPCLVRPWCLVRVKGLVWLGLPAEDFARASRFFAEVLGLDVAFDESDTIELAADNDDRIQVFGPGHRYFEIFRSHGARIVPLLEVDDLDQARATLAANGIDFIGEPESDGVWTWITFRGPEGSLYSLGSRHR